MASYNNLYNKGLLQERVKFLKEFLTECRLCPRNCKVNRIKGNTGFCGAGLSPWVSSYTLHFGEEPPISGYFGSGTIFFTFCNLKCVFCQNYPISHLGNGNEISVIDLAYIMVNLQKKGAHNINLVTPTHFVPQIVEAILIATEKGLSIPIVYNCGGYESVEVLRLLEGVVDIYLPDAKYSDSLESYRYSGVKDYFHYNKLALKEMYKQVGILKMNKEGVAEKGLLIRHLVLPEGIAGSRQILKFISERLSKETYLSIMAQYHPAYRAYEFSSLSQKITQSEYNRVIKWAEEFGLKNIFQQRL